jgi:pyridinium-3,5-biscarboxylic acid mononucleotide sulfurtransferase
MSVLPCNSVVPELSVKRDRLLRIFLDMGNAAVAFSGGIDSTVVAKGAFLALGNRAVAITADSPSLARTELEDAKRLAAGIGIRHLIVSTEEFQNPDYIKNDRARCYFCKSELFERITKLLPELGMSTVCSGANVDDQADYRPGMRAAAEHAVRHPLQEADLSKAEVRALARYWELPTWDKPASPCLSSRLAPGVEVTFERVRRVEDAEAFLRTLGLTELRVRIHQGELARIEVPASQIERLADEVLREQIATCLRDLGFRYITLDLEGFRSGNLNSLLSLGSKSP